MTRRSETGRLGEDIAAEYLAKKSYRIIERNYLKPWGEIDIIAKSPDRTIVFVEVKTVNSRHSREVRENSPDFKELTPEDQMTSAKLRKLRKIAQSYSADQSGKIIEKKGWRIDLVAVTLSGGDKPDVKHYENI